MRHAGRPAVLRWFRATKDGRRPGAPSCRRRHSAWHAVPKRWRHVPGDSVLHVTQVAGRRANGPETRHRRYGELKRFICDRNGGKTRGMRNINTF